MHILFAMFFSQLALASSCPSNAPEAFRRFEQIQSVNAAAHALSGQILFSIQPIEHSPRADGSSVPKGTLLQYTVDQEMLPGSAKLGRVIPVGNAPKADSKFAYGIDKLIEEARNFGKLLAKEGVTPFSVSEKFQPKSYISNSMFYIIPQTNEAQVKRRNGKDHNVYHYLLKPKPKNILVAAREKRDPAQFSGELWINAEDCMPILMTGALNNTAWAVVDKFEVEFESQGTGFYPTRIFIRTFVSMLSRGLSGVFSLGMGVAQSTETSIAFVGSPSFRPIHTSLLR